jgi:hypothetical protein
MRSVRRVVVIGITLLAFAASATTAQAQALRANCSCGSFSASGSNGWVGETTRNSGSRIWGGVKHGTIWAKNLGHGSHHVRHYSHKVWDKSRHSFKFTGSNMTVTAGGLAWVRISGTSPYVSSSARAAVYLHGSGRYYLNGRKGNWPSYGSRYLYVREN